MKFNLTLLVVFLPMFCLADSVVPIDSVQEHVNIRMSADAKSEIVGRLNQGDSAELISSLEGWYEIVFEGDGSGFVSADWTRLADGESSVEVAIDAAALVDPKVALAESVEEVAPVEDVVVEAVEAVEIVDAIDTVEAVEAVAEVITVGTDVIVEETDDAPAIAVETEIENVRVVETADTPSSANDNPVAAVQEPAVEPSQPLAATLKGTRDFLVRFRDSSEGVNSQMFDSGNRIGIGTTTPKQRLEVNGSIQIHEQNSSVAGLMITQSTGETGYIMHNRASTLTIGAGSKDRITIDRHGNVGIGTSRPAHPLEMASGAHVTQGGVWVNSSSRSGKENIVPLSSELAESTLLALDPVQFDYKTDAIEHHVGFIAEDVPELVAMNTRDGLSTMDIVAVLTRVVQEQQRRIDELEKRLDQL